MPGYFFDSSALAKHYYVEVGTAEVDRILQLPDTRHFIARLALVEIRSVFAGKVRTGVITEDDFRLLRRRFLADVTTRRLQVVRLTNASYRAAGRLIEQHATHRSLRTLDALHLAAALDLRTRGSKFLYGCGSRRLFRDQSRAAIVSSVKNMIGKYQLREEAWRRYVGIA